MHKAICVLFLQIFQPYVALSIPDSRVLNFKGLFLGTLLKFNTCKNQKCAFQ